MVPALAKYPDLPVLIALSREEDHFAPEQAEADVEEQRRYDEGRHSSNADRREVDGFVAITRAIRTVCPNVGIAASSGPTLTGARTSNMPAAPGINGKQE